MSNHAKIRKTYNYLISAVILLITWGFIYRQVFHKTNFREMADAFSGLFSQPRVQLMLCLVVVLAGVNWGIEASKWRFLIRKIENVPRLKSFSAVLSGIAISTFTPNRVGEFFGRVFILERAGRFESILITILGSMSQLLITILTGTFGLAVFIPRFLWQIQGITGTVYWGLLVLIVIMDALLLLLYFNISLLALLREKICVRRWRKYRKFLNVFSWYRWDELCHVITLSFLRYLVFSTQYFILLRMFGVPVPVFDGMIIITVIFLVMTIIPTIALTELGIRGSLAIYFFGICLSRYHLMNDSVTLGILSASTLIWIINLAIPAFAGSLLLFRLHFFRKTD